MTVEEVATPPSDFPCTALAMLPGTHKCSEDPKEWKLDGPFKTN